MHTKASKELEVIRRGWSKVPWNVVVVRYCLSTTGVPTTRIIHLASYLQGIDDSLQLTSFSTSIQYVYFIYYSSFNNIILNTLMYIRVLKDYLLKHHKAIYFQESINLILNFNYIEHLLVHILKVWSLLYTPFIYAFVLLNYTCLNIY